VKRFSKKLGIGLDGDIYISSGVGKELKQAGDFYAAQKRKTGLEFLEKIYSNVQDIIEFPKAFSKHSGNNLKCIANRFHFIVFNQIKKKGIFIAAITYLFLKLGYWRENLNQQKAETTYE
jgi:hypothetical protein